MSYLKLEIGGQERGLKFNQMAYILFYQYVDQSEYVASMYYAMVFAGLKSNCFVKREECTESFEEVCEWVDAMSNEDKAKVLEVFSNTSHWKELVDEGQKEQTPLEKKRKSKSTTMSV